MSDPKAEIMELAASLRPDQFVRMVAYFRSDGHSASRWLGEWVSGSREPPLPVDDLGNAGDQIDRELQLAKREYLRNLVDILRLLRACAGLEAKVIVPIEKPDAERLKAMEALVSDAESCLCGEVKEVWVRNHKTEWRLRAGLGPCCYSAWKASGVDKVAWLKVNRPVDERRAG